MGIVKTAAEALAINGGRPVRRTPLPYGRQSIDQDDIQAVVAVLSSAWITTGPKIGEFEEALAAYVGAKQAVSFSSGTAALHAASFAAGLQPGDEAVTTPLTFCATANAILYQGATPVFADVSADTLNIDPQDVASRLTSKAKALLPVDYAGHPADLAPLMELAAQRGLTVIEDACHALGANYGRRKVGSVAHMTVFSFHPVKHITTGEGGMVVTDNLSLARRLRMFRNHGIESDARQRHSSGQWFYEMTALGYNYRLTDVAAALGLSQLRKIEANLSRRRQIAARYAQAFKTQPAIQLPEVRRDISPAWHLYPIRLNLSLLNGTRDGIFHALKAENIGVNVHYIPVHLHAYYKERFGYAGGEYPVAETAYARLLSLPMFHGMTDTDIDDVVRAVTKVIEHYLI